MVRGRGRTAPRPGLSDSDVDRIAERLRADAGKALAPSPERAAGRTYTTDQVLAALTAATRGGGPAGFRPMPRDPRDDIAFGPLRPLAPDPLGPLDPRTGRAEPWLSEYPVGWNVPGSGERLIPWRVLRAAVASGGVDIMRRCIEVRKNRVAGLQWSWKVRPEVIEAAYRADGTKGHDDIAAELRDKWSVEIDRLTAFWEKPWRSQGLDFAKWTRGVMEERLVLDALPIYPRTTYGGDLYALEIIAGDTVKPLLDYRGARPLPPFPAYQQVLYGFPRGEFTATTVTTEDGATLVEGGYLSDQLIYIVENYRAFTPYGFSPTEQALVSARLYMKRQGWMFAEYDEASMGEAYATSPETSPITPGERVEYERSLNDEMGGQTAARHRIKALFPGMGLLFPPDNAERYKPEYDMHLIKLVCTHYGVPASELGFSEVRGLGSSGMHESMKESQDDSATQPDIAFMESLVNVISTDLMSAPAELFFGFNDPDGESEKDADEIAKSRMERGSVTVNEDRTRIGLPRFSIPEADKPFVMGAGGPVFLEGSAEAQQQQAIAHNFDPRAARTPDKPQAGDNPGDNPPVSADARSQANKAAEADAGGGTDPDAKATVEKAVERLRPALAAAVADAKAQELAAYRKFVRRGHTREFTWAHHDDAEVAELLKAVPPGKSEAAPGDVPPPPDTRWPGWAVDAALVALVAKALARVMHPLRALAARFADHTAGGAPVERPGVASWLKSQGVDTQIAGELTPVLRDAVTEAYAAGARAAQHVLAVGFEGTVDWGGWKPGDVAAARRVLSEDGLTVHLGQLLESMGARITKVAATRLDEIAAVLADGLERGEAPATIATALRGVLDDPQWALTVAWTETNRAMSAAALDSYELAGVDGKAWFTANDQRVCPICKANEDQGAIPLGAVFISGESGPPGHPRCRCSVVPEDLPESDAGKLAAADLAKVGPKGYEHGWIFVGAPGVGHRVFHPRHGHGEVTAHGGGHVTVRFDAGHEHSFDARHRPDATEHFAPTDWREVPAGEHRATRAREIAAANKARDQAFDVKSKARGEKDNLVTRPDEHYRTEGEQLAAIESANAGKVHVSGDNRVVTGPGVTEHASMAARETIADLNREHPLSVPVHAHVGVRTTGNSVAVHSGTHAHVDIALDRSGHEPVHSTAHDELQRDPDAPYRPEFVDSAHRRPEVAHVITHEYGHQVAHERGHNTERVRAFWEKHRSSLGSYGRSDPAEGYAEAFAEWHATRGHPKDPEIAAWAKEFGWATPSKRTADGPPSVPSLVAGIRSTTRARGGAGAVQVADVRDALAAHGVTDRAAQDDAIRRAMRAGEIDVDSAMDKRNMTDREINGGISLGGQIDHWITVRHDKSARATGHEGDAEQLHAYWTRGEGLAKWRTSPHPWTALYHHLLRHIRNVDEAKRTAAAWYHDATGTWPGSHHGGKHS